MAQTIKIRPWLWRWSSLLSNTWPFEEGGSLDKVNDSVRKKKQEVGSRYWQSTVSAKIKNFRKYLLKKTWNEPMSLSCVIHYFLPWGVDFVVSSEC